MRYKTAALALLVLSCATVPPAPQRAAETGPLRYTVLMTTHTAGSQVVTRRGPETVVDYEYTDRGRGPKSHSVVRLDDRGLPLSIEISGNDYMKQPVDERFAIRGGRAEWKNSSETGSGEPGSFYVTMYGPPEEVAMLIRAALRSGGSVPLYPAGVARVRRVGEESVRGRTISAYEISGFGFAPFEVWLDENLELFGMVSSWSSTIREGFEKDAPQLIAAQDRRVAARIGDLAARLTHTPTMQRLSIVNARIFDPRTGILSAPTTINVEGNRIASIGVPQERNAADVIDAAGKVVLPGLWDMHTHASDIDGLLHIAAGITSARDLGNDDDTIQALKKQVDTGVAVGPRLMLAGLVDGPGPFQGPTKHLVATEEDARKSIDFFADRGYEGLKIYSSIKPELVPFLTRYAHERGLRVSGHIPAGMRASQAVEAGYDEIQHANMLLLNFMPDVTDTRTPARFLEPAKRAADLDLQSAEVQQFIRQLKDRSVVVDPTLTVFEGLFTARLGSVSPTFTAIADRLPIQVRRSLLSGGLPVPEGMDERYRASFRRTLDLIGELHRAGVRIVPGTDNLAGFALHRELELYVEAGIPAADVLRIATLIPAQIMKRDKDLGTIEVGKLADFVIVNGDPTRNISDIRRVETIVKDGKVFRAAEIYAELGVR